MRIRELMRLAAASVSIGTAALALAGTPQTIAFDPLPDKALGDPSFSLAATASSGLAVTFGSATSGTCTLSGTTVSLVAGGTCTIDADQAGDASFDPAPRVSRSFNVKDLTPNALTFTPITSAPLGILVFSNAVTVSGISESVDISVTGGEYSVGCTSTFASTPGTIASGALLCLRHNSASVPLTGTTTTVAVGRSSAAFESTTEPPDTTPDQFHFSDVTGVEPGSTVVSLPVPVLGTNVPSAISIVGGEYSIGCTSTFLSTPATVNRGDVVCARLTTASGFSAVKTAVITIGGVSDEFSTLTRASIDPAGFSESLTRIPGIDSVGRLYRDPTTAARVIATTGSGVAVSEDAGLTWSLRAPTSVSTSLYGLSVDTATPGTWYGITINQLYKTTDYGNIWSSMQLEAPGSLLCFGVNPANPDFLVLAAQKTGSPTSIAFYISQTGGGSWTLVVTSIPVEYQPPCEFAFDGVSGTSFYFLLGAQHTTVYRIDSPGGAITATHVHPPSGTYTPFISSRAKPQDSKSSSQLWLFTQCVEDFDSPQACAAQLSVDASTDGGTTFSRRGAGNLGVSVSLSITAFLSSFRLMDISVESWLGSKMGIVSQLLDTSQGAPFPTSQAIFESISGGASWQRRPLPTGVAAPTSILAVSTDGDGALLASTEKGVFRKRFGEEGWRNSSQGLKAPTVRVVAASRASSSTVMIGTQEAGIYLTTNGGNAWDGANQGLPPFSNIASGCFDSASDLLGYVVAGTSLYRTTDRAQTWLPPPAAPPLTNVRGIYCPNGKPNVSYAAGSGGLFTLARSDNAGVSWTNITGLGGASVNVVALAPTQETLYVATAVGLFRSTSANAVAKISDEVFFKIAVSPTNPLNVYAVASEYVLANPNGTQTVYGSLKVSGDGGLTWRKLPPPEPLASYGAALWWGGISDLALHPVEPGVLFISSTLHGVFVSFDDGATWRRSGTSAPSQNVYSLDLLFAGLAKAAIGVSRKAGAAPDTLLVIAGGADGYVSRLALSTAVANPSSLPRLGNISTRGRVLTGDNVMIGGFVIGGSVSKTVLIRARGPSMIPAGVTDALADPTMTLVNQSTGVVIATNDNWVSGGNSTAITATGKAPTSNLESAILTSLAPGAYTVVVSGVTNGVGVGIVEVFEIDGPQIPLVNISTRGRVLTGDNVMIGGFVIDGTAPQQVLIRARGPSMIPAGVLDALADPTMTLVNQSTGVVIGTNDNWVSASNASAITATGKAPTSNLESAILITLDPGAYTVVVSGVGGGVGVGIVEVFAQ